MSVKPEEAQPRDLANEVDQLSQGLPNDDTNLINRYIGWVSSVQRMLRHYYVSTDLTRLHTTRYWHLHDLMHVQGSRRIPEMVRDEAEVQCDWLKREADDLQQRADRFGEYPTAMLVIVDTNIFLHGELFDQIPWRAWLPVKEPIQLIVPIRVIDELDSQKFRGEKPRARKALRALLQMTDERPNVAASMGDGVTIETYVPSGPRQEMASGDTEILDTCEEIRTFSGRNVTVLTRDVGMDLRARNAGFLAVLKGLDDSRETTDG